MKLAYCKLDGRDQHLAGRELLRKLYLEETGREPPPVRISEAGYPHFETGPFYFSITHTDRHAFCVLSRNRIGIDAEELDRRLHHSLPFRVLSPFELEQYHRSQDKVRAFLTFWVLKEALFKCRGTGLVGFPNRTRFRLDDPRVSEVEGCLLAIIEEGDDDAV